MSHRTNASVRRLVAIAAALVLGTVAGPGQAAGVPPAMRDLAPKVLRFGDNAPPNSPTGRAAEKLAELAAEKTGGKLTIKVYPANQLGSNRDLVEQTALRGLDMSMEGVGILGYIDPVYNFMQVPFLFRDQAHIHTVLDGPIGQDLAASILKNRNIRLLSQSWDRLPRQICSKQPIRKPADLANVLIRTGSKGATQAFKMFGAKPASIPLNEVYLALQNNVVSAVDLPADYIYNLSLYEVCGSLDVVNHTYGTQFVAINGQVFDALPKAYQKALLAAVREAGAYNNKLDREMEGAYIDKLRAKGMQVIELTPEQHQAFVEVIHRRIDSLEAIWPNTKGLGERIFNTR